MIRLRMLQPQLRRATQARSLLLAVAAAISAIGLGAARAGTDIARAATVDAAAAPVTALADVSRFVSEADARVEEAAPSTNFGDAYLRADGGSDPAVESYLRFAVAGLAGPVTQATLRVYAASPTADGPAVYPAGDDWSESGLTWANRPARTGPAAADVAAVLTGEWVEYDVTELIRGNGTYTLSLASDNVDGVNFRSREDTPPPELVVSTATGECDRYASPSGSDSQPGTAAEPFHTAQRLAESLSTGQTGCLRAGTYDVSSGFVLRLSRGGYTLRSYPGEVAKLLGIVMVGNGAPGVTLSHLEVEGTGGANTIKIYAADVVVEDSDITNRARGDSCMILGSNSGYGQAVRPIVRRNRFHDCGSPANGNQDHGIYAENVVDGKITGNVVWNSAAYAIHLYPNAQRTVVAHNVVDGDFPSVRGGVIIGGDSSYASSDNIVEQNVISYAASYNITSHWSGALGSGNIVRNNCLWAGRLGDVNTSEGGFTTSDNLIADPLFLDRVNRDYRLGITSLCRSLVGLDAAARLP
jgi:hypothetical protein